MKLFKRKSVRKIKSEMNRIKIEMDKLYITPFMPKENYTVWNEKPSDSIAELAFLLPEEKPGDFEASFNSIMLDKLRDAVRERKIEVAKNMYNYKPIEEPEDNEVEDA